MSANLVKLTNARRTEDGVEYLEFKALTMGKKTREWGFGGGLVG